MMWSILELRNSSWNLEDSVKMSSLHCRSEMGGGGVKMSKSRQCTKLNVCMAVVLIQPFYVDVKAGHCGQYAKHAKVINISN